MIIPAGETDVTTYFKLVDPTAGTPETGLVITNLDATYIRDRAAAVKADLTALALVTDAHADNKAIEVDGTNAPGVYRVDWPDAAFASGVDRVQLVVNGAAIDPAVIEVELSVPEWVWAYATRTLTTATGAAYTSNAGGKVTIHRGDSMSVSFTGLGDISGRSKLWFTVKSDKADADTAAIIMIEETAGLLYLNGAAAANAALGDITVTNAVTGAITVVLDETMADDLVPATGLRYDVQMLTAAGAVSTLTEDVAVITADVSRVVA
jgi:hypothetical protein